MGEVYFYSVGYDHFESSNDVSLCSDKLYSKEEFKELCAIVTADIYQRRRELFPDRYVKVDEWNREIEEEYKDSSKEVIDQMKQDPFSRFEDLCDVLVAELTARHGFKTLHHSAHFFPFGFAKIIPKDDLNGDWVSEGDDIHLIRNKIPD